MTRPNRTRAPEGADGTCRNGSRPQGGARPGWLRPLRRAQRALHACVGLIDASFRKVLASERDARQRPARTSRELHHASGQLVEAARYLSRAARELAETNEWIAREPERARFAPECLLAETEHWLRVAAWLSEVAGDVFAMHETVISGLETGAFVPEPEPVRRRRIVKNPRTLFVRAFLSARRRRRALDRITPLLLRRRRTPRPAEVRVPRRNLQGRAPPLSPVCAF